MLALGKQSDDEDRNAPATDSDHLDREGQGDRASAVGVGAVRGDPGGTSPVREIPVTGILQQSSNNSFSPSIIRLRAISYRGSGFW
jgi:hypothetical protein